MIERKTMNISLTPELHAFVSALVQSGGYSNAIEVRRAGLRLLQHDEAQRRQHDSSLASQAANERA